MPKSKSTPSVEPLAFEEGLGRLEALVDELEGGELSLEEGVEHYREGVELLVELQKQLAGAESRVGDLTAQLQQTLARIETDDNNPAQS